MHTIDEEFHPSVPHFAVPFVYKANRRWYVAVARYRLSGFTCLEDAATYCVMSGDAYLKVDPGPGTIILGNEGDPGFPPLRNWFRRLLDRIF